LAISIERFTYNLHYKDFIDVFENRIQKEKISVSIIFRENIGVSHNFLRSL